MGKNQEEIKNFLSILLIIVGDKRVVKRIENDSINSVCKQIEMEPEEIIEQVTEQISEETIKLLLWYGSRLKESDTNLLAVLKEKQEPRTLLYKSSRDLNILTIGKDEFMRRLELWDPMFTEPVMTGILLLGDKITSGCLRSGIMTRPSQEAIEFLKEQATARLKKAEAFLNGGQERNRNSLLRFLTELSFAGSYGAFAGYYGNGPKFFPITFSHLLVVDGRVVLREIMRSLRILKSGKKCDFDRSQMFQRTQKLLESEAI